MKTPNKHIQKAYISQKYYGCGRILKNCLQLPDEGPLPLTIAHGIDFYAYPSPLAIDILGYEPLYLALREDIAERAAKYKRVIKFPHPWLLIIEEAKHIQGRGTLFIAPPPSEKHFERMHRRIQEGSYPKPWGILLKDRGLIQSDFDWWAAHGFAVHTAGSVWDQNFLYQLRDIIKNYEYCASPNMSSAVIFAVAMSRKAIAIADVSFDGVDGEDWARHTDLEDKDEKIRNTWTALLSSRPEVAQLQAEGLLGNQYMAPLEVLRSRLLAAIAALDQPLYLHPLRKGALYTAIVWLTCRGIPAYKLFPNPWKKISRRLLALVKLNRLAVCFGSDFAHYGVAGTTGRYRHYKKFAFQLGKPTAPGYAYRVEGRTKAR